MPISTCPLPDHQAYAARGRFGAHNIHENTPSPCAWYSEDVVIGTFFNGGLRAYDIADPYRPAEVAVFVPPPPRGAEAATPAATTGAAPFCSALMASEGEGRSAA